MFYKLFELDSFHKEFPLDIVLCILYFNWLENSV